MSIYDIIYKKRMGGTLSRSELEQIILGYTEGVVPDYQMSAFAMAVCFQGMTDGETALLTDIMAHSGQVVDLSRLGSATVDKHSTGGVGDKTTLVVAPLVASLGGKVAKMTGRGLGHTGGTIDKLESIPGFQIGLDPETMLGQVEAIGIAVAGQTADLAPADRKLYALRDVTATVDSMPLMVSSIMSKKLASGAKSIVLDVTVGSGSFSKTLDFATSLSQKMLAIGKACGRSMAAVITDMNQPLGYGVGNALEVQEAIRLMKGADIPDLKEVCITLAANMLMLCRGWDYDLACREAEQALNTGRALAKFREWIAAQGGDTACIDDFSRFPVPRYRQDVIAAEGGWLTGMETQAIGRVSVLLGAGRESLGDTIDYGAGLMLCRKLGDRVWPGDILATLFTNRADRLAEADAAYRSALTLADGPIPAPAAVLKVLHSESEPA